MTKGCPKCGRMIEEQVDICPYCHYHFSEKDKIATILENDNKEKIKENASVLQRLTAFNFDLVLLVIVFIILGHILKIYMGYEQFNISIIYLLAIIFIFYFFYCIILEASALKGTIGARLVNIMVVDEGGYQIGFAMSLKRNLAKILNVLTLFIGFFALAFTKNNQTVSDYLSETYVRNRTVKYNTKLYYAHVGVRLFAFIIDVLILALIYFALNFLITYFTNRGLILNIENAKEITNIFMIIIFTIYFAFMDSKNGTIGKQIFEFKVTDLNGNDIGFFKALSRVFLLAFEILCLPLGLLLWKTMPTKQTFKDLITKTVVIQIVYHK